MNTSKIKDFVRKFHVAYLRRRASRAREFIPEGRVLIVAPHPDDEVIGCGGLIARLVSLGRPPYIIVMTGGEASFGQNPSIEKGEITRQRRLLTRKALKSLGVPEENLFELDFPDGSLTAQPSRHIGEFARLKDAILTVKPDTILVPHWGEGWSDHVNTSKLVREALSEIAILNSQSSITLMEYCVWVWYYNVWRGINWKEARCLHLSDTEYRQKLTAIEEYVKPTAPNGHPWSGNLPDVFIAANSAREELYFKSARQDSSQ